MIPTLRMSKVKMALVLFNASQYVACCERLVSILNDTIHNLNLFNAQMVQPAHELMYQTILYSRAPELLSTIDYQILKIACLICAHHSVHSTDETVILAELEDSFQGVHACYMVIGAMKVNGITYFTPVPALTISKLYYFLYIFFLGLTNETYALATAKMALATRTEGEPGLAEIERDIVMISSMGDGVCAVCRNRCEVLTTCGRCGVLTYCSPPCQTKHWKNGHRARCGPLKKYCDLLVVGQPPPGT